MFRKLLKNEKLNGLKRPPNWANAAGAMAKTMSQAMSSRLVTDFT